MPEQARDIIMPLSGKEHHAYDLLGADPSAVAEAMGLLPKSHLKALMLEAKGRGLPGYVPSLLMASFCSYLRASAPPCFVDDLHAGWQNIKKANNELDARNHELEARIRELEAKVAGGAGSKRKRDEKGEN